MSMRQLMAVMVACWMALAGVAGQAWGGGQGGGLCCPGDITGDGMVDGADLGLLLASWGASSGEASPDLDGDGVVGGSDLGILLAGWGACPRTPCLLTSLVGTVVFEGGLPVESAVLVTDQGGKGVSGVDGAFSFQLEVAKGTTSLTVTAVASVGGVTYTGSKQVSRLELGGMTDVGAITVTSGGCAGEFAWLPTFGGGPGVNGPVRALTVFDDGLGGGPALYAGGWFTESPAGDSYLAKWGCDSSSPDGR